MGRLKGATGATILYTEWIMGKFELYGSALSMTRTSIILRHTLYYCFLAACTLGFLFSCCGFLLYRLLLKPLVFGLMLLVTLPLMGASALFHKFHALAAQEDEKYDVLVGESQTKEL